MKTIDIRTAIEIGSSKRTRKHNKCAAELWIPESRDTEDTTNANNASMSSSRKVIREKKNLAKVSTNKLEDASIGMESTKNAIPVVKINTNVQNPDIDKRKSPRPASLNKD